jgi:putative ABC transport system permease protein
MNLLIGALTLGLVFSLLALGVYVSFRIFDVPDITAEGSITLGGAVAAALIMQGVGPVEATLAAVLAGGVAGGATGTMATKLGIQPLLAGILSMTALYSVNLRVMGRSNIPIVQETTLATYAEGLGHWIWGAQKSIEVMGWQVATRDASILLSIFALVVLLGLVLNWFFQTEVGSAMRAAGSNPQMISALGVSVDRLTIIGLALSNGLIALSGALLAQVQGFADVQMGIGIIALGLASVIIGEALVGSASLGIMFCGAIMGSLLFRLLVAIALRAGLNPNDLKLITALFVLAALTGPTMLRRLRQKRRAEQEGGG